MKYLDNLSLGAMKSPCNIDSIGTPSRYLQKNGEGFRRGRILKHFLMDVDFKNPVRVRVRVRVSVRNRVRVRVGG